MTDEGRNRKMRQHRYLMVLVILALFAGAGGSLVLWKLFAPKHRINQEGYEKIKVGMSQDEVEAILLVPPGNYTGNPEFDKKTFRFFFVKKHKEDFGNKPIQELEWLAREYAILVFFDNTGQAVLKYSTPMIPEEASLLEKIRRWIGL